jgi:hypothetical protein
MLSSDNNYLKTIRSISNGEEQSEDRDHIWKCPRVMTGFLLLSQSTAIYVQAEVKANCESNDCFYDPEEFLLTPAARGIITKNALEVTYDILASLDNNPHGYLY